MGVRNNDRVEPAIAERFPIRQRLFAFKLRVHSGVEHKAVAAHAKTHDDARPRASAPAPAPVKLEGEGTLLLASSPWVNVKIDGQDKGPTPLRVTLQAGKHTVLLSNPEFKINRSMPVMILPNETLRKKLDF